jgi:hypothetical protein
MVYYVAAGVAGFSLQFDEEAVAEEVVSVPHEP